MFFDEGQTLGAIQQVERPPPDPRLGGHPLIPLLIGILISRKLGK